MGDISKVKLPDNQTYNIKDSRITGIDTTPTSGSGNVITSGAVYTGLSGKQNTLVSGTNIKTVNNNSLLGSGNVSVGTYSKPSGGIPKTDLASGIQTSLDKADTALQSYTETDPTVPSWAKASSKPSYSLSEISGRYQSLIDWGGPNLSGSVSPLEVATIDDLGHNKFAFASAATVTAQYSRDGGSTWTAYGTDAERRSLVTLTQSFKLGNRSGAENTVNDKIRIILNSNYSGGSVYTSLRRLLLYVSTNGSGGCTVRVEHKTIANASAGSDTWNLIGDFGLAGWSGWNSIPCGIVFGGSSDQTTQSAQIRLTFSVTSVSTTYGNFVIQGIRGIGFPLWQTPSNMASNGHLYSYDISQNATFPAKITSTGFVKSGGTSSQFLKADGSVDSTAYTTNTGTITGINMNGASKGTSGVVDLGTVITAHQSIKTINSNTITGTGNVSVGTITGITMNGASKGTSGVVNLGTVITDVSGKADLASPTFTGTPKAPTAAAGTNTTQIATTAFVQGAAYDTMEISGEVILSTHTTKSYYWTGTSRLASSSSLKVGTHIIYVLQQECPDVDTYPMLNLTFADGTTSGNKYIYISNGIDSEMVASKMFVSTKMKVFDLVYNGRSWAWGAPYYTLEQPLNSGRIELKLGNKRISYVNLPQQIMKLSGELYGTAFVPEYDNPDGRISAYNRGITILCENVNGYTSEIVVGRNSSGLLYTHSWVIDPSAGPLKLTGTLYNDVFSQDSYSYPVSDSEINTAYDNDRTIILRVPDQYYSYQYEEDTVTTRTSSGNQWLYTTYNNNWKMYVDKT